MYSVLPIGDPWWHFLIQTTVLEFQREEEFQPVPHNMSTYCGRALKRRTEGEKKLCMPLYCSCGIMQVSWRCNIPIWSETATVQVWRCFCTTVLQTLVRPGWQKRLWLFCLPNRLFAFANANRSTNGPDWPIVIRKSTARLGSQQKNAAFPVYFQVQQLAATNTWR